MQRGSQAKLYLLFFLTLCAVATASIVYAVLVCYSRVELDVNQYDGLKKVIPEKYVSLFNPAFSIPTEKMFALEEIKPVSISYLQNSDSLSAMGFPSDNQDYDPVPRIEEINELRKYDPENGRFDIFVAECIFKQAFKYDDYDKKFVLINKACAADLVKNIANAFQKKICTDRSVELQKLKLDVLGTLPDHQRLNFLIHYDYQKWPPIQLLAALKLYAQELVKEKKYSEASRVLDLSLPMYRYIISSCNRESELSWVMNYYRVDIIDNLRQVGELYLKVGKELKGKFIIDEIIPDLEILNKKWAGLTPDTEKEKAQIQDMLKKHSEFISLLLDDRYYHKINSEMLIPLRFFVYLFYDMLIFTIITAGLFIFMMLCLMDLLIKYFKGKINCFSVPPSLCWSASIGTAILFGVLNYVIMEGFDFLGRDYNCSYNSVGIIFQYGFIAWISTFIPLVAACRSASLQCRKNGLLYAKKNNMTIYCIFFSVLCLLLTGIFLQDMFPDIRKWGGGRPLPWYIMFLIIGGFMISVTAFIYGTLDFTGKYTEYVGFISMNCLTGIAVMIIVFSLILIPITVRLQDRVLANDRLLEKEKIFFRTVPETEAVVEKKKILLNIINKIGRLK